MCCYHTKSAFSLANAMFQEMSSLKTCFEIIHVHFDKTCLLQPQNFIFVNLLIDNVHVHILYGIQLSIFCIVTKLLYSIKWPQSDHIN